MFWKQLIFYDRSHLDCDDGCRSMGNGKELGKYWQGTLFLPLVPVTEVGYLPRSMSDNYLLGEVFTGTVME